MQAELQTSFPVVKSAFKFNLVENTKNKMAATGDSVRQAVDLDNLIQEYMHFEKVSLNVAKNRVYLCSFDFFCRGTSRLSNICQSFESCILF